MSIDLLKATPVQMPEANIPKAQSQDEAELRKVAKEFESMFMNLVVQKMRETVPESGLFEEGGAQKIKFFESMLDEEYSKLGAKQEKGGLADMIYQQLSRQLVAKGEPADEN